MKICGYSLCYFFRGRNYVKAIGSGLVKIHPSAKLRGSRIYIYPGGSIHIAEGCHIENATIYVGKGSAILGAESIIDGVNISIDNGEFHLGDHSKLACKRVWTRFGGSYQWRLTHILALKMKDRPLVW